MDRADAHGGLPHASYGTHSPPGARTPSTYVSNRPISSRLAATGPVRLAANRRSIDGLGRQVTRGGLGARFALDVILTRSGRIPRGDPPYPYAAASRRSLPRRTSPAVG